MYGVVGCLHGKHWCGAVIAIVTGCCTENLNLSGVTITLPIRMAMWFYSVICWRRMNVLSRLARMIRGGGGDMCSEQQAGQVRVWVEKDAF